MESKELKKFMLSLWDKGLLTKAPEELDYEWIIWDYQRVRIGEMSFGELVAIGYSPDIADKMIIDRISNTKNP